jgi:ribosome maturation protein SDO1
MPEYTVARYKRGGKRFEILVDPDKALEYKLGRRKEFDGVLVFDEIYIDANKGLRASKSDIQSVFGTTDINVIAEKIVREGELQIKAEQRRRLIEEKKKQIIDYITRYCVDARTNLPIPPLRLKTVLEESSIRIDPFKSVDEQIKDIISSLSQVIPIKQQITILNVRVPAIYVGKVYGYIRNSSDIVKEEWLTDGSLNVMVSIPSGLKIEFIERLGRLSNGTAYVEVAEEKAL